MEKPRPSSLDIIRSQLPQSQKSVEMYIYFNTPSLPIKTVLHQYRGWLNCVPTSLNGERIETPVIISCKAVPLPKRPWRGIHTARENLFFIRASIFEEAGDIFPQLKQIASCQYYDLIPSFFSPHLKQLS